MTLHTDFALHPQLAADTFPVTDLPLCSVLLMNDRRYPWLILVPRRHEVRELFGLDAADRFQAMEEMTGVAAALEQTTSADKMNVAALGNSVPQLHIHVIARFHTDAAWPRPVWGVGEAQPYEIEERQAVTERYRQAIASVAGR